LENIITQSKNYDLSFKALTQRDVHTQLHQKTNPAERRTFFVILYASLVIQVMNFICIRN
jgi:hypothetical protein